MKKLLFLLFPIISFAQFTKLQSKSADNYYSLNKTTLTKQVQKNTAKLPNQEGVVETFTLEPIEIIDPLIAKKYGITTFKGISKSGATVYMSKSIDGVSATILGEKTTFIDNVSGNTYRIDSKSVNSEPFECGVIAEQAQRIELLDDTAEIKNKTQQKSSPTAFYYTVRLALSVTGEYTRFHGGTISKALASAVNTITRVNSVFERDFASRIVLVGDPNVLFFTDPAKDPYTTTGNYGKELKTFVTSKMPQSSYDIAHVFGAISNGGNAGCISCLCIDSTPTSVKSKDIGYTNSTSPIGDSFDIDYVAHELAHVFGMSHVFSYRTEGGLQQTEPGAGTSIGGYAGLGGIYDIQAHSDPYFNQINMRFVNAYLSGLPLKKTSVADPLPISIAPPNKTIPKNTPFEFTNSGLFNVDQNNVTAAAGTFPKPEAFSGVQFRSYPPTTNANRSFPSLELVKTGQTCAKWECASNRSGRTMNFILGAYGKYGVSQSSVTLTVSTTAADFRVNYPNTGVQLKADTFHTIEWNVGGTTSGGVNCANVDISISIDGGDTFTPLLLNTPNDGFELVKIPNTPSGKCRIKVKGSDHYFYDMSDADFTILPNEPQLTYTILSKTSVRLNWTPFNNFDAVSYSIYMNRECENDKLEGALCEKYKAMSNGLSATITGLVTGKEYRFDVKGKNAAGYRSEKSNEVLVVIPK